MLKKKCSSCAKKSGKKHNFCPWCGSSFKAHKEENDFGMLGRDDTIQKEIRKEAKLPFGMNTLVNSLIKQLEKQMGNLDEGNPKGFKIQISSGRPQIQQVAKEQGPVEELKSPVVPEEEEERRSGLIRENAESKVKRLGDVIIYEISTPGVRKDKDVAIAKLEQGLEVKAYSKDKCYVKVIPLKVEVIGYEVRDEKVFVELKG
jgi:hypothetical protein